MLNSELKFRIFDKKDWKEISEIYRQGIKTENATFQIDIPSWAKWDKDHLNICRIVAEMKNKIIGWVALSPVSSRCVYSGVAEVSVYVSIDYFGKKIGTKLLDILIKESEKNGIWTLQSGIFPENKASLKIHYNSGFRKVGYREKIGKLNGIWRDTVLLERRSEKAGVEQSSKSLGIND